MAIKTTGQLALGADIYAELGGAVGTTINVNNTYVRALIGKAAGVEIKFSEFYGASAVSHTITTGSYGTYNPLGSSGSYGVGYRAFNGINYGSIAPATHSGATIWNVSYNEVYGQKGGDIRTFRVIMQGTRAKNFFTSISHPDFSGGTLLTSNSSHSNENNAAGVYTLWQWSAALDPVWSGWVTEPTNIGVDIV